MESSTASQRSVSCLCFHFFLIFPLATLLFVDGFNKGVGTGNFYFVKIFLDVLSILYFLLFSLQESSPE